MIEIPQVDERLCRGEAACVAACPVDCLELHRDRPVLARPQHCIACALCVLVCPVEAIQMVARPQA